MPTRKYCMSFTTGSLFHRESLKFAMLFLEHNNWEAVRESVLCYNHLQARTQSTLKRVYREIASRLQTFSYHELNFFVRCNFQEQKYLLWIAVCRRYRFIADFAIEILREHYISLKSKLHFLDFDFFFVRKSEWYPELDGIQATTRTKLRQVLFKMLRETGLITTNNIINTAILSPQLLETIFHNNKQEILFFPTLETHISRTVQ